MRKEEHPLEVRWRPLKANAFLGATQYLLFIFRYSCTPRILEVDPKPIASWRRYAGSSKLAIVQLKALQGFVGLGRCAGHPAIAFTLPWVTLTVYRATAEGDMLAHENTICGSDS